MIQFLNQLDSLVWGVPLLVLLVGTGIMLTIRLRLIQLLKLPQALTLIFKASNSGEGDISSFGALCTALAATVGTGNIIGVATAIAAGMKKVKEYPDEKNRISYAYSITREEWCLLNR